MEHLKLIQNQLNEALYLFKDKKVDLNLMYDYISQAKTTLDDLIEPKIEDKKCNCYIPKDKNKLCIICEQPELMH